MTLLSYTEFLTETYYGVNLKDAKVRLLKAAAKETMSIDENEMFLILLKSGYQDLILEAIDTGNYNMINESILSKAKEKYQKLKDTIADKGKVAINKMSDGAKNLLKIGGNILKPVKAIIEKMGGLIKAAWDKVKSATQSAVSRALPKLTSRLENLVKDGETKKSLNVEMDNLKSLSSAGLKLLTGGFTKMLGGAAAKASST